MSLSLSELPPIPSMLVQAFPLEAYLRNLNNKLSDNLNAVQRSLVELQEGVKSCETLFTNVRQFLRKQVLLELQESIAEGGGEMPEGFSTELLLPEFLRDPQTVAAEGSCASFGSLSGYDGGQVDSELRKMYSFKKKLDMERLERIRGREEREKKARQQSEEARKRLEQMCEGLELSQKQYMEELERLTLWLRPSPVEDDEDEAVSSGVGSAGRSGAGRDNRELQEVMRGAPLLVEFRRLILRDVMDRLGELKDEQSMTMGNIMASLKEEMRKELCRNLNGAADGRVGPEGGSRGEAVCRLKGFDQNYVQRGEVVATLQEKADRATVAQKADEVYVHDLEKRLLERMEDLEERMTIYEAERTEFRRILRSLVDVHRRGEDVHNSDIHRDRDAANNGRDDGATRRARALPNFVVLDEAIEPQRARECESLAAEEPRAPRRARQRTDLTTSRASARVQEKNQSPCGVVERKVEMGGKAVGLTANQEAYANYVTNELNRRVVESLPPLPYERGR
ncbi:hypothetical protein BCY84_10228 [Trypanosoma cruzi cruzi]|nr:hypothetical protein BCY84_10228 [Trypanosoma cruzi cruzi]